MDQNTLIATVIVALIGAIPAIMSQRTARAALEQGRKNGIAAGEAKVAAVEAKFEASAAKTVADQTKLVADHIKEKTAEIQTQTNGQLAKVTDQLNKAHDLIGSIMTTLSSQQQNLRGTRRASDPTSPESGTIGGAAGETLSKIEEHTAATAENTKK